MNMIHTNFHANGAYYQLITVGISRHEREALAENIKPDPDLWKKRGRRGHSALEEKIPRAKK